MKEQISFLHSVGFLYSVFTYYTGFKVDSDEYEVMGLAPYGKSKYADMSKEEIIDVKEGSSFSANMDRFNYCQGLAMTNSKFDKLFGGRRGSRKKLTQREMDMATSI